MTKLAGKVALVTGGSRGIGAAVARRLAADGAAVALTYANGAAQAADVAQSIEDKGGRAVVIHADHADPPAAARAVEQTVDQLRRLDILVNNAGIFTGGPLEQAAVQDCGQVRIRQLPEEGAPARTPVLRRASDPAREPRVTPSPSNLSRPVPPIWRCRPALESPLFADAEQFF